MALKITKLDQLLIFKVAGYKGIHRRTDIYLSVKESISFPFVFNSPSLMMLEFFGFAVVCDWAFFVCFI